MDPNATLKRCRKAGADYCDASQMGSELGIHVSLVELWNAFEALDDWLTKGGFLPTDWQRCITGKPEESP